MYFDHRLLGTFVLAFPISPLSRWRSVRANAPVDLEFRNGDSRALLLPGLLCVILRGQFEKPLLA